MPTSPQVTGRYAPSPSGDLHLGNLRTAMAAWLLARREGGRFVLRVEDLDPVTSSPVHEARQLADLAALGLDWDPPVVRQSERRAAHDRAVERLVAAGATYECFCTRREIAGAARAPHGSAVPEGAYPGTCRDLTEAERAARRADGRRAAVRLRVEPGTTETVTDLVHGTYTGLVDDVVLRRADGIAAYNLAVVVDDHHQGVTQVVRGDDLLASTPRQVHLAALLGLDVPAYAHVPLVLNGEGRRLAKRDGAVTLADLAARGVPAARVRAVLAASMGWCDPDEPVTMEDLLTRTDPDRLPTDPWVFRADALG